MLNKIEKLDSKDEIKKEDLLTALKEEIADISIIDIMIAHAYLVEECRYVQGNYREEYLKAYTKGFIIRVKEIRDNNDEFEGIVDKNKLREAIDLLNKQHMLIKLRSDESHFFKIYNVVSIYTTFVLNEPIHVVGTPFPGGFKVKYEDGIYYCPVKEKQKENPGAVCGFCIAEQDEDV